MIDMTVNYADKFAKSVRRHKERYPKSIHLAVKRYNKWKKRKDIFFDQYINGSPIYLTAERNCISEELVKKTVKNNNDLICIKTISNSKKNYVSL